MTKFLFICNSDGALYKFRYPIIKKLIAEGHEVYSITTGSSPEGSFIELLEDMGVKCFTVEFGGRSANILKNIKLVSKIKSLIKKLDVDVIHSFTHKANILTGLALIMSGSNAKLFYSITGLGIAFTQSGMKNWLLRKIILSAYFLTSYKVNKFFFQNPDDKKVFIDSKVVQEFKSILTFGSGLDPIFVENRISKECSPIDLKDKYNPDGSKILILFPSRALYEKGVKEFYAAVREVSKLRNDLVFVHVGSPAENSSQGLTAENIISLDCKDIYNVEHQKSIFTLIQDADLLLLPSYREGTPRSLIEGLYFDKPILTTRAPGCDQTVINDWNGKLFLPRCTNSLIEALMWIDRNKIDSMQGRSKMLFESRFHSKHILNITFSEYFN